MPFIVKQLLYRCNFADMNKLRILRCTYYSRFSRCTQKYHYKCPCEQWSNEWSAWTIGSLTRESKVEWCKAEIVNQESLSSNLFQSFQNKPCLPALWLTLAHWNSLQNSGLKNGRKCFLKKWVERVIEYMNHESGKKTTGSRRGQEREGGSGKRKYYENATISLAALPAN